MNDVPPGGQLEQSGFNPVRGVLSHWRFSIVVWLLVIALGLSAFLMIPRTEDPVLDIPEFAVTAVLPGTDPISAEQQLTRPIEDAVYRLDGIEQVRSYTSNDVAWVGVRFRWGTNVAVAYNDLQREMDALRDTLPAGLSQLDVIRYSNNRVAIRVLALASETLPMRDLDRLARRLRERVGAIPGVREVKLTGATPSEVSVAMDTTRMSLLGINAQAVVAALRDAGHETPIGKLGIGEREFNVRFQGAYPNLQAIRDTAVPMNGGAVTRVGDVAIVKWAVSSASDRARFNGKRAVLLAVSAADGQDVTRLSAAIDTSLTQFERSLPGGVRLEQGFNQATNLENRIDRLERDFVIALALIICTLLPIGWRAGLVVMIAVPLSLLFGLLILYSLGFTLNQLSIAGFVLSLGLLVDDAIVVVENIVRWRREGYSPDGAVVEGTKQITLAVIGCTSCLIFAFLPLLALPDVSGAFIRSLPVAVFATVIGSMIVALTAVPLAARFLLTGGAEHADNPLLRHLNAGINRFYAPVLRRALKFPKRWLLGLYALSLLAIPAAMLAGTSLFPKADVPQFLIDVRTAQGASLATTEKIAARIEARARAIPNVQWVSTNVGRTGPRIYYNLNEVESDPSFAQVAVGLKAWNREEGTALLNTLRREFARIPGAIVEIVELRQGNIIEAPVAIRISGPDIGELTALAARGEAAMAATPGLVDVNNPLRRQRSEIRLVADEGAMEAHGVSPGVLRETLQIALTGVSPASLRDSNGIAWPVVVSLSRDAAENVNRLDDLDIVYVPTNNGGNVPLSSLVRASLASSPSTIDRVNRVRTVTLTANVASDFLVNRVTDDAAKRLRSAVMVPPGYAMTISGEAAEQAQSFGNLGPAVIIALLGILAVLILEFGKMRAVFVVLGILPFGFLGALVALLITGNSLSFTASIGMIALIGIEIKNSILLVDFAEQLRGRGIDVREAVERAGELRFLPVLLTTVTAIGGLLPLAIEGNGLYAPLAIALIGGLVASTLLARIATPVMYLLVIGRRRT